MNRKKRPAGLDYYSLYLLGYLREHHPDKADDGAFIEERAGRAAGEYEQLRRDGASIAQAQEAAMLFLLEGLHFSRYDLLRDVLEDEFAGEVPEGEISPLARKLLPLAESVFSIYELTDEFARSPEYNLLRTELTGAVALYLEEHGI